MASAKNRVIAGDYAGKQVLSTFGMVQIATSLTKGIPINKTTIEGYELITDEHRKSAASGVARGDHGRAVGRCPFGYDEIGTGCGCAIVE